MGICTNLKIERVKQTKNGKTEVKNRKTEAQQKTIAITIIMGTQTNNTSTYEEHT